MKRFLTNCYWMCRRDNPNGFYRTEECSILLYIFYTILVLVGLMLIGYIVSVYPMVKFYSDCIEKPEKPMCVCEESPFGMLCILLYLCVGFGVSVIFAFILVPIGILIGVTLSYTKCIISGLINKYKQADAIYTDSLTKKDDTVIDINN
jgi:hypothetical protein